MSALPWVGLIVGLFYVLHLESQLSGLRGRVGSLQEHGGAAIASFIAHTKLMRDIFDGRAEMPQLERQRQRLVEHVRAFELYSEIRFDLERRLPRWEGDIDALVEGDS